MCLERIAARRVADGDDVYLEKKCPRHGAFRTILWRGPPSYDAWGDGEAAPRPRAPSAAGTGCPFECGLCPEHLRPTCCVLLEVTSRCNLCCPTCFADSAGQGSDPGLDDIEAWFRSLVARGAGAANIQLSGGEPTLRDDLPEVMALGRSLGFGFLQLNTNGLRLARDDEYVRRLKEAGLSCVFLQFDGVSEEAHLRLRGAPLLARKVAAIDRCAEHGLGVVLVPTLVPGVNTEEIGAVIDFAARRGPAVRGVHFQPVSYFGRYPRVPSDADRITLPEVMRAIERQTGRAILATDLSPPSAENAFCSFSGSFVRNTGGTLRRRAGDRDRSPGCCSSPSPDDEVRRAREYVARRWAYPEPIGARSCSCGSDGLDRIISEAHNTSFCISGMAFQDAWNIDLARLRECYLHVASPDGRLVPFCAYNATSAAGTSLHRRRVP